MEITKALRVLTDKDKRSEYDRARAEYLFKLDQGIEEDDEDEKTKNDEENVYWTT